MKHARFLHFFISLWLTLSFTYGVIYAWNWLQASSWDSLTASKRNELYSIVNTNSWKLTWVSNTNGNIWIGISSPSKKLEVDGWIQSHSDGFVLPDGSILNTISYSQLEWWNQTFNANTWTSVSWNSTPITKWISVSGNNISFDSTGIYRITLSFRMGTANDVWTAVRLYWNNSSRWHSVIFWNQNTYDGALFTVSFLASVNNSWVPYMIQIGRLSSSFSPTSTSINGESLPALQATIEKVDSL